ncbi:glycosylhydrolase family 43 protein [Pseudoscourfieldia marina]
MVRMSKCPPCLIVVLLLVVSLLSPTGLALTSVLHIDNASFESFPNLNNSSQSSDGTTFKASWSSSLVTSHARSSPPIRCNPNHPPDEYGKQGTQICIQYPNTDGTPPFCEDNTCSKCTWSQRDAPPDGKEYAFLEAGAHISQRIAEASLVSENVHKRNGIVTLEITVYTRGLNPYWPGNGNLDGWQSSESAPCVAKVSVSSGSEEKKSVTLDVGAPTMKGYARAEIACKECAQDDGANVWFMQDYRLHIGGTLLYQRIEDDPINTPWSLSKSSSLFHMAPAPFCDEILCVVVSTHYNGEPTCDEDRTKTGVADESNTCLWSKLTLHHIKGTAPDAITFDGVDEQGDPTTNSIILQNPRNNEHPWVIDAHLFKDKDTGRLWMTWGGHETYITELNPLSGRVCCKAACKTEADECKSTDINEHKITVAPDTSGVHTKILTFDEQTVEGPKEDGFFGDGCSTRYQEGPSLWKYGGKYFAFSSWGSMGTDYTIRVCRADDPRGPYKDKDGNDCVNRQNGGYGSTMVLGPEGEQSVPGHAHIWVEKGQHYLGYDFRKGAATKTQDGSSDWDESNTEEGTDFMAVRRLYWVGSNDDYWPTIWTPIRLSVNVTSEWAADEPIELKLENVGEGPVGFDDVTAIATLPTTEDSSTPTTATPTTTLTTTKAAAFTTTSTTSATGTTPSTTSTSTTTSSLKKEEDKKPITTTRTTPGATSTATAPSELFLVSMTITYALLP